MNEAQPPETPAELPYPEAAQPTLGELLVAARERWNLSAADVARQLRLGLRQVENLEANRFETLPGNTFVRGFIRNYAKVVQLDAAVFLDAYERCRPQLPPREIVATAEHIEFTRRPTPQWVWYAAAVVALAVTLPLLIYFALHDESTLSKPRAPVGAAGMPNQAQALLALPAPQIVPQGTGPNPASSVVANAAPGVQSMPMPSSALGVMPLAVAGAAALSLHFNGDAWVEIRNQSGKKLFSQLNRAGSEQVVRGTPPFALVVGNAAQVRITYNGKPVDLAPYIRVNVARLTLE